MHFQFLFGPLYLISKIIITYFAFYLFQRTRLKGSLLLAVGMLILSFSQLFSQYLSRLMREVVPIGTEYFSLFGFLNVLGYILFAIGFVQLAVTLTQKK
ncbi:MAG: hypothetical protein GC149_02105 [Gammaproteobacteria bacterium]|nr:hypothetical protein [Gammaproteobacteria bacterium]